MHKEKTMNRLILNPKDRIQDTVNALYQDLERRIAAAPQGNCPVALTETFLRLCLAQSCGKCVPCRVGLNCMTSLIEKILDGKGVLSDLSLLEKTAKTVYDSADCAIGFEAAALVLNGLAGFREDYLAHIETGRCTAEFKSVPCVNSCPAHVDIPGYAALVKEGRYADAVRLIRKDNPFPSVCGLICEHPCEHHCRRALVDAPINIRGIKRFAADHAGSVPAPARVPANGKKAAVIGGGPSGLTAAYFLSLMGVSVTVYEKRKRLGGMLRYGIPCYRLPDAYLDQDIDVILSLGIEVKTGISAGRDITLEELRREYDSVYISIGAHSDKKLGIDGEDARGVISAVSLLGGIGDGEKPDFTGKRVVVIGGGNVAMDVTRTSMRLGAESVTCAYRRRIDDMTALREEIDGAMAESCEILPLMAPVRIEKDREENVTGVVFKPQVIGAYDRGRPKPYPADAPEVTVPADIVVVAIGQAVETGHFEENGVSAKRNCFLTDEGGRVPGMDGVFSGGDCVFGPATVIKAIEAGKVAAANISEYLGIKVPVVSDVEVPPASFRIPGPCGRVNMTERPAEIRRHDFELMENGMSLQEVRQECSRCLRCDHFGMGKCKGGRELEW